MSLAASAQLVISEISYNPPESGADSLEYIELYNSTNATIDLAGYIIEDNNPDTILAGSVPAGGYAILAINPAAIQTVLGVSSIAIERIATNNGGERIAISSPSGVLIDEVTYDDEGDWPTFEDGTDGAGATIELCDLNADNDDGNNWGVSTNSLGVQVGGIDFLGTPNAANSATCEFVPDYIVEVTSNKFTPKDLVINVGESVRWMNVQGFHNVNGSQATYPNNPEGFANGSAASGAWVFDYTFTVEGVYDYQCDPHVGLGMVGTVTVNGMVEPTIPTYDIGAVNATNGTGVADSVGVQCIIEGVVHGANLRSGGLTFSLIDASGDGIGIFSNSDNLGYTHAEGDLLRVTGFISQFNGLTQTNATAIELISSGNALQLDEDVTILSEATESKLIRTVPVRFVDPAQWLGDGSNYNVEVEAENGAIFALRIDADTEVASAAIPGFGTGQEYDLLVTGIGGQFDDTEPFLEGYQLFPRYESDFSTFLSVQELDAEVSLYPNPVTDRLYINADTDIDTYEIINQVGQQIRIGAFTSTIDVSDMGQGLYMLILTRQGKRHVSAFVK